LTVERSTARILAWSSWRRWHQAWARYYHYRRREREAVERAEEMAAGAREALPQSDMIEEVWRRLLALLPPSKRSGRPYSHDRRVVLEAIVYVMQTDCGWRNLPSRFPRWQTVYAQLRQWRKTGIWAKIWSGFEQPHPTDELQL
jgi:putative transposase of IS4/5 family DUF4096